MIFRELLRDRAGLWIMVGYAVVALGLAAYVIYSERTARLGGVLLEQRILSQEVKR
jgi:hypothetical protein